VALGADGTAKSSMGVDAADFDNDGDDDILVTELTGQGSDLYVNDGSGVFEERSTALGVHAASLPSTGFGTRWIDVDNDGWLDILAVNGAVTHDTARGGGPFALEEPMQLLRNLAGKRFEDVTNEAGDAFRHPIIGRGAAFGDLDNDGSIDVVVATDNGPVLLLINRARAHNHWLGLRLIGANGSDGVGATVEVSRSDGLTLWRRSHADGSYASSSDPRVTVGLGSSSRRPRLRVHWPDGTTSGWIDGDIDRYTTVRESAAK
jgi:hypothetical protein